MCTFIAIDTKDKAVLSGRTCEYAGFYDNEFIFRPRNFTFPGSFLVPTENTWTNKYSFTHMVSPGIQVNDLAGGNTMNEHGLQTSMLAYHPADYRKLGKEEVESKHLDHLHLANYITGNYKTVQELRDAEEFLSDIFYWPKEIPSAPFANHYAIVDATGDSVVVEPENGRITIKENPLRVLTNSSPLEYHYENLRKYGFMKAYDEPATVEFPGIGKHKYDGKGTALFGMPGDFTPDSRFVRSSLTAAFVEIPETAAEGATLLFRMLSQIADIVPGVEVQKMTPEDVNGLAFFNKPYRSKTDDTILINHTDTIIINDSTNLLVYYKTFDNITPRVFDFGALVDHDKVMRIKTMEDNVPKFQTVEWIED